MAKSMSAKWMQYLSIAGLIACVVLGIWFWQQGLLTSQELSLIHI